MREDTKTALALIGMCLAVVGAVALLSWASWPSGDSGDAFPPEAAPAPPPRPAGGGAWSLLRDLAEEGARRADEALGAECTDNIEIGPADLRGLGDWDLDRLTRAAGSLRACVADGGLGGVALAGTLAAVEAEIERRR